MNDRLFQFSDEKSDKFWRITLRDKSHTVTFGRTGTGGQTQTKEFPSESEARSSYDKLIQEKLKKGYVEMPLDGSAVAPPAAPPPAAPPAPSIDLDPSDWRWATWRDLPPLPRPSAPPFDRQEAIKRMQRVPVSGYGWQWDWSAAKLSPVLSPEEASFWLEAMLQADRNSKPDAIAAALPASIEAPQSLRDVAPKLVASVGYLNPSIVIPLVNLFGAAAWIDFLLDPASLPPSRGYAQTPLSALLPGTRSFVLPYLSAEEMAALRAKVRKAFPPPASWPTNHYEPPAAAFGLGAALGLHDEIRLLVESWPDDRYTADKWVDHYHRPQEIVFGLGSASEVDHQMRRLQMRLRTPQHIRAWLAHTEVAALDYVRDSILANANKEEAAALIETLALVHAPEAAPIMVDLLLSPRSARGALDWLNANPELAAVGLLPLAATRGAAADAAIGHLRTLKRRGFEALMRSEAERLDPDARERVRATVIDFVEKSYTVFDAQSTPAWLAGALPEESKKKKSGEWVRADELPAITVGDSMLSGDQVEAVLRALQASKTDAPHALVTALRDHTDRDALDRFAWRLFDLWLMNGAVSKENWAMAAVGLLGGDASALKLTPMIRLWPGESQHQRAVLGLECLRAIGSDTALMQINGIAQRVKFKGLKTKAAECMEQIAQSRGLTRAQLEDRIVPDCDLDERGSRIFDFGPRRFTFVLGQDMKPLVRDEAGKTKPDLPKPGAKDDAEKADAAVSAWKLLKKQVAEVAKIQAVRLEQAMVTGRRWSADEFELLLLQHPLMTNLARLLVWGIYDGEQIAATFRVTEDQTLADSHDQSLVLDRQARVGIAHPLQLSEQEKSAWGELFADYEIIPPFPQLGRAVHALDRGEEGQKEITRFAQTKLPPQTLVFTLEKLGWERGIPQDAGIFFEHSKPFYGADVTAVVSYPGVPVGYMEGWEEQMIERCFFVPGIYTPHMYPEHTKAELLDRVDPIVISEVLSDLIQIVSKAK